MNYRIAEQKDMEAIIEVFNTSFNTVYAYYARKSVNPLKNTLIAEDETIIAGVISWRIFDTGDEKIGYLFWLAVHPDFRRKGVGEGLIAEAIRLIQEEAGTVDVYAAIEKNNQPSIRLFEKTGFTLISRSAFKEKYGLKRFRLYSRMMLIPKENLYLWKGGRFSKSQSCPSEE